MKYRKLSIIWIWLLVGMALFVPRAVHAATGGAGLPWETPLTTLSNSVTGNVAYAVSLIGIVGAGGVLIFAGGQVNEFLRAVLFCVLVIAFIIAAKNTLTAFGFAAGAEITQSQPVTKGVVYGFATRNTAPRWN
jgi:type IV secretion system protein TrbC